MRLRECRFLERLNANAAESSLCLDELTPLQRAALVSRLRVLTEEFDISRKG
jgi:hypothetical protein